MENYKHKIDELTSVMSKAQTDIEGYAQRLQVAQSVEGIRKTLEAKQLGSKLNTLAAVDTRAEMQRASANALEQLQTATRDREALQAESESYAQSWSADVSQKLSEAVRKLSDVTEVAQQGEASPVAGRAARRSGRHRAIARQGVGRLGAAVGAAVHHPGSLRRAARDRGQRRRRPERLRPCRRSRLDQVRHLPVLAIRPCRGPRAHGEPEQLHRAGRAAQSDELRARRRGGASRSTAPAFRSTASSCTGRRRGFTSFRACRSPPTSRSGGAPCSTISSAGCCRSRRKACGSRRHEGRARRAWGAACPRLTGCSPAFRRRRRCAKRSA